MSLAFFSSNDPQRYDEHPSWDPDREGVSSFAAFELKRDLASYRQAVEDGWDPTDAEIADVQEAVDRLSEGFGGEFEWDGVRS